MASTSPTTGPTTNSSTSPDASHASEHRPHSHSRSRSRSCSDTGLSLALKIGYDGRCYHGSAEQRGRDIPTVERSLRALVTQVLPPTHRDALQLRSASRTDRGVSALGNVWHLALPTGPYRHIPAALNAADEPIWCFGVAKVPPRFKPRHAVSRWYRYLVPARELGGARVDGDGVALFQRGLELFCGEHEFAAFCKSDAGRWTSTRHTIDTIELTPLSDTLYAIELRASHFLWNQVRRMVGALFALLRGRFGLDALAHTLEGEGTVHYRLAPAEPLILMAVEYEPALQYHAPDLRPLARRRLHAALDALLLKKYFLGSVAERIEREAT